MIISGLQSSILCFADRLLSWYDQHSRTFPWRVKGACGDPYRVWVSEIMLQQTTVTTVAPYFQTFMSRWPTLHALAEASLDEVLHAWQGLGYYTRARALHACAQRVLQDWGGRFPETEVDLLALPGIGPYTAAAILTIAFEKPCVAVDGNIIRVLSRHGALCGTGDVLKKRVRAAGATLLPEQRLGDYTQALMDLGAQICTPRSPRCDVCPVFQDCQSLKRGAVDHFPEKAPKRVLPVKYTDAFWIQRQDGHVLFQREETQRLLRGLMRPPMTAFEAEPSDVPVFPFRKDVVEDVVEEGREEWKCLEGALISHTFTHFKLMVRMWQMRVSGTRQLPGTWVHPKDFHHLACSTLVRKMMQRGLQKTP